MATSRLPFLYPNLLRSVKSCEPSTYRSIRYPPRCASVGLHTSQPYEQETVHQRYGPAAEPRMQPPPWPKDKSGSPPSKNPPKEVTKKESERDKEQSSSSSAAQSQEPTTSNQQQISQPEDKSSAPVISSPTNVAAELGTQGGPGNNYSDRSEAASSAESESAAAAQNPGSDSSADPLESIFRMPPPGKASESSESESSSPGSSSAESEQQKPPHISPPAYVHHFDTYTLVKELGKGGFTEEQSVQIMKGIRGLLADNLTMARDGLYSKSDFENETYLFRAACSELRNSLQTSRNAEIQAQRSRRAQLQHEADILSQRMNQELTGLNDNLKEMFNDQKIWTRESQRSLDTALQELNYQITVSLHSDGRSEVESLRWILTRRAALAIGISAGELLPFFCRGIFHYHALLFGRI